MGNPPPLSVDPEQLAAAGNELNYSAGQLPDPPGPFGVVGSDPLTQAISAQIPAIEDPIATQLPAVKAQATKTAGNVIAAADAYLTTDQQLGGQISQEMQNLPAAEGLSGGGGSAGGAAASAAGGTAGAAGSAAGGAGSMSQMMGVPMQMASQMSQMPTQAMSAVTSAPQGVMQGAQQAGQQVQQMVGQFGEAGSSDVGSGPHAEPAAQEGAAAGDPAAERAPEVKDVPEAKDKVEGDDAAREEFGGRHRRVEVDPGIDL
ncbi:hypothetical protein [Mycolicibacterium sp. OfavD-34-C]|uniref:hypothetical protein n=1 Tax=Mycolicibacterium sp. OfavD-34-C TaxID=2917746 RepID=UPI001EF4E529|nr:hypothetical protein [Mycolicibacterium sp. OfavD-34-C]MCG7581668.1 hypothetical protein [Mycolicibacterium sp. OfavD-34-C]